MTVKRLLVLIGIALLACGRPGAAQTNQELKAEIEQLKQQLAGMDTIKARLTDLEKRLDDQKKAQETAPQPVVTSNKDAKIKLDGRMFVGFYSTGKDGAFANASTDLADARLRLTFNPSKNVTIVNRMSTTGGKTADFDYFYVDVAGVGRPTNTLRLGQRKLDFGIETWDGAPEECAFISNSPSFVTGYGIGVASVGRLGKTPTAPLYEIGMVNGPKGVSPNPGTNIPFNLKLGQALPNNGFASISYFNTGELAAASKSALSVADITDAPAGATKWRRTIMQLDWRYNHGPTGIRTTLPNTGLPKIMLGATYGVFKDSAQGAADRNGKYWYVEGSYDFTPKLYGALRYGTISLDDGYLAKLAKSPVAVNAYHRTSLGLGYRLTPMTDLKTEYSINNATGGVTKPDLNQFAVGVATKF